MYHDDLYNINAWEERTVYNSTRRSIIMMDERLLHIYCEHLHLHLDLCFPKGIRNFTVEEGSSAYCIEDFGEAFLFLEIWTYYRKDMKWYQSSYTRTRTVFVRFKILLPSMSYSIRVLCILTQQACASNISSYIEGVPCLLNPSSLAPPAPFPGLGHLLQPFLGPHMLPFLPTPKMQYNRATDQRRDD